jgi:hypothetical protein
MNEDSISGIPFNAICSNCGGPMVKGNYYCSFGCYWQAVKDLKEPQNAWQSR